jgi:hypothetical protein
MVAVNKSDLLRVWEEVSQFPPGKRSLHLVRNLSSSLHDADSLSVGERDRHLLMLRREWFGDSIDAVSDCPRCQSRVEIQFSISERAAPAYFEREKDTSVGDYRIRWRLPTAKDVAQLSECLNATEVRKELIQRCLLEVQRGSNAIPPLSCPEEIVAQVCKKMSEADPLADSKLELQCPNCQYAWLTPFDIGSFFWRELDVYARRLLHEVHTIASAYGWSEESILNLSDLRRMRYLEILQS